MPRATNGDVEIEYQTFGPRTGRPLLLIMGLATQMTAWHDTLCRRLVDRGHFVIRFDNRDCGLSSRTPGPPPRLPQVLLSRLTGGRLGRQAPYDLGDMARDALAVLDDLGLDRAHVVGVSMGGMIAQMLAIDHAERVLSLTSIMSTTGAPLVGRTSPRVVRTLLRSAPSDPDRVVEHTVNLRRLLSGPLFDETTTRELTLIALDRSFHPGGRDLQLAAIAATGDRTARLASVAAPTLVLHGEVDPLINVSGGRATAAAIPGARLVTVPDLGHDLPPAWWDELVEEIDGHTAAADAARGATS